MGQVRITRKGLHGLCGATPPKDVDRALEELQETARVQVQEEGRVIILTVPRLAKEAESTLQRYIEKSEKGREAVSRRWARQNRDAAAESNDTKPIGDLYQTYRSPLPNDTTVQYSTVQDITEQEISDTPRVDSRNTGDLEQQLSKLVPGWMNELQRVGRPQRIIMAPSVQRRWWYAMKTIGLQMIEAWPCDVTGAVDGLNRLVTAISSDISKLRRYINAPQFLTTDWPTLVEPVQATKKWTENDERATQAAIAEMVGRRARACQASSQA